MNCKASWIVKKVIFQKRCKQYQSKSAITFVRIFLLFLPWFFSFTHPLTCLQGWGRMWWLGFFFPFYLWRTEVTCNFLNYYQRTTFNDYEIWTNYHALISEPSFNKKVRRSTFNETLRVRSAWIILYFSKKRTLVKIYDEVFVNK